MLNQRVINQLQALKRSLAAANPAREGEIEGSFSRVFTDFLILAEEEVVITESKMTQNAFLKGALQEMAKQLAGAEPARLHNVIMLHLIGTGMIHGGFFIGSRLGSFFFFVKEGQGLVGFCKGGGKMLYTRLTRARESPVAPPVVTLVTTPVPKPKRSR